MFALALPAKGHSVIMFFTAALFSFYLSKKMPKNNQEAEQSSPMISVI
jgi:hypothetical protein